MQQLHQVRTARPPHAEAAASVTEQSHEEREHLRAVRHHAFQRHQRNAAWMREILQPPAVSSTDGIGGVDTSGDKQQKLEEEIAALQQSIAQSEEAFATDHLRHTELLAALRSIDSEAALAACRTRVYEESTRLAQESAKEPKVIKL